MIRAFIFFLLLTPALLLAEKVQVQAPAYVGKQAQLIRFTDYFTYTPELLSAVIVGENGMVDLDFQIEKTELALIRIDHVNAYLYLSPGQDLNVVFPPLPEDVAHSIGNTNLVELSFIDLDKSDANAILSKLNDRVSEFYDLFITMHRVEDQKGAKEQLEETGEGLATDPPKKKYSLKTKVDTLAADLAEQFKEVKDPVIRAEIESSIALLYWNANVSRKWLYQNFWEGWNVHTDSPTWVDLFRTYYQEFFRRGPLFNNEKDFRQAIESNKDPIECTILILMQEFVKDQEISELLLLNGIYETYHSGIFDKSALREVLESFGKDQKISSHHALSGTILKDLTTLERYLKAPSFSLIDNDRNAITLEDYKGEYVYLTFWASWCTSCLKELNVMKKHHEEYGKFVQFLSINIDEDPHERSDALMELDLPWMDLYHINDPLVLDRYRIRSVPQFFLIGPEGQILEAPASKPSEGIGASFHRIKVAAKKNEQIKVWDD